MSRALFWKPSLRMKGAAVCQNRPGKSLIMNLTESYYFKSLNSCGCVTFRWPIAKNIRHRFGRAPPPLAPPGSSHREKQGGDPSLRPPVDAKLTIACGLSIFSCTDKYRFSLGGAPRKNNKIHILTNRDSTKKAFKAVEFPII